MNRTYLAPFCVVTLALATVVSAAPKLELPVMTDAQIELVKSSRKAAGVAYGDGDHVRAAKLLERVVRLAADNEGAWYDLACTRALMGRPTLAMDALESALAAGWRDASWPAKDADLEVLHGTAEYESWTARIKALPPETAPELPTTGLAMTEGAIDAGAAEAFEAWVRLSQVLGPGEIRTIGRVIAAWKVASWDGIADRAPDEAARAAARFAALEVLAPDDLDVTDDVFAPLVAERAKQLVSAHSGTEQADLASVAFALAATRGQLHDSDESTQKAARNRRVADLQYLAATLPDGPAVEAVLVGLMDTQENADRERLAGYHARLVRLAGPEKARDAMLARYGTRALHFKMTGLPDFEATTLDGARISPASLRGTPALLDFWATWCGPCRRELPHIKAITTAHGSSVRVIGISLDETSAMNNAAFRAWCEKNDVTWAQVLDGKGFKSELAKAFGINSIPFPILIDAEGSVVAAGSELRGEELARQIAAVIKAEPVAVGGQ